MNTKINIFGFIILAAAFLAGVFLALNRVDAFLRIKAVDDCAKISQFTQRDSADETEASYPIVEVYKNCLKDKGY